jgi:hypothetical protein
MKIQPEKALFSLKVPIDLRLVHNPEENLLESTE